MVQQSLIEYVNKLINSGYDTGTIRTTLINAGYSPYEANRAINYATSPVKQKKEISLNLKVILIVISILILLVIIIIAGVKILTPEEKTIQIKITPLKTEIFPGNTLSFLVELSSDTERKEQALLNYEIINTQTNELLLTKQERITVGEKSSTTAQIQVPQDTIPGKYTLKATMSYKIKTEQKSFTFTLLEPTEEIKPTDEKMEEEQEVQCPATCDDFNPCTKDYCEKGICKHTQIIPCCGNGICESTESRLSCPDDCAETTDLPQDTLSKANTVAASDPEAAATLCNKLTRINDIEFCFAEVAQTSGKSIICENIQTPENKDNCYMAFALDGDYTVCSQIKNSYLSKSCYSLKRSSEILSKTE